MSECESPRPAIAGAALSVLLFADKPLAKEVLAAWETMLTELKRDHEILVVGDDAKLTRDEHPRLRVLRPEGLPGTSSALRAGLTAARHPLLAFADGDPRYRPNDLKRLLERIDRADLVIGCRTHPVPGLLRWIGRVYRGAVRVLTGIPLDPLPTWLGWKNWLDHVLLRLVTGVRLHDVNCGLQLFRREVVAGIPVQAAGPFARAELIAKINFLGGLMDEVPVVGPAEDRPLRPMLVEGYRVLSHAEFGPR